jgi:hypothetical protein
MVFEHGAAGFLGYREMVKRAGELYIVSACAAVVAGLSD